MSDVFKGKPDAYWREVLSPQQYRVLRDKATEAPGSGEYLDNSHEGIYKCAACGLELFKSSTKFESTMPGLVGWPAFFAEAAAGNVELNSDTSLGQERTEITCARCGSHLGHLFTGDPASETGQHYCVNSVALKFDEAKL